MEIDIPEEMLLVEMDGKMIVQVIINLLDLSLIHISKLYRCDKCGWEPEDPAHPPKFCPECGDRFDDGDVK